MKKILITGAKGFLGSNTVKYFKASGYETYGIGHGNISNENLKKIGLDYWQTNDVSIQAILKFRQRFDVIVHCGGSGSVNFSLEHTNEDFNSTVDGTLEVLEYIKKHNPNVHLIYPSSPAVQGEHPNSPIKEEYIGKPTSPYGYHKKIAEDLCQSYSKEFDLNISVVRLFSLYGKGLRKQLLWDACEKISNSVDEVIFWGTGNETRDFIHINDVLRLFDSLQRKNDKFLIINGGTGIRHTVRTIVEMLRDTINPSINIIFNHKVNKGNPSYYCADVNKLERYGFKAKINLEHELKNYVDWVKSLDD